MSWSPKSPADVVVSGSRSHIVNRASRSTEA